MYCPKCGKLLPNIAQFCGECGMCLKHLHDPFSATHPNPNPPPSRPANYGYGWYPPPYYQNPQMPMPNKSNVKKSKFPAFIMTLVGAFLVYSSFLLFPIFSFLAFFAATPLGIIGLIQGYKGRKEKEPYHLGCIIMGTIVIASAFLAFILSNIFCLSIL